jgi:hypothetical protein
MQLQLFEGLSLNAKACITWRKGVHIACRSEGKYYMALYRLNDFYVEIQYHTCYDGIADIKTFVCEEQLKPYLNQIDLSDILS